MKAKERKLVDKICIDICDGAGGRCQRYPALSLGCESFSPLAKAYKAGIKEVVDWIEGKGGDTGGFVEKQIDWKSMQSSDRFAMICEIFQEDWQAQLKGWGL